VFDDPKILEQLTGLEELLDEDPQIDWDLGFDNDEDDF
jgi:hypothetical protein